MRRKSVACKQQAREDLHSVKITSIPSKPEKALPLAEILKQISESRPQTKKES
ncbi:MAG: hypothetical protein V1694_01160 [Candidatus Eisenbacteria bacterium]